MSKEEIILDYDVVHRWLDKCPTGCEITDDDLEDYYDNKIWEIHVQIPEKEEDTMQYRMTKKEKAELLIFDLERLRSDDPWDINDHNIECMISLIKELVND